MEIKLSNLIEKHANCVAALDLSKNCNTCKFLTCEITEAPCSTCYNEILGMPVNPTNYEATI